MGAWRVLPAEALDNVDCCDPSSMGVPSGPVVTTEVTEPPEAAVTWVAIPPDAVVVMPLSIISEFTWLLWELGVELGGGIGPSWV